MTGICARPANFAVRGGAEAGLASVRAGRPASGGSACQHAGRGEFEKILGRDPTDVMGDTNRYRQLNGPHKVQLGWIPQSGVTEITSSGTYTLAPTEFDPASTRDAQVLTLPSRMDGEKFYLSYRVALAGTYDEVWKSVLIDGVRITNANKLSIHRFSPETSYADTILLGALADSERFTLPLPDSKNAEICVISSDDQGVRVEVSLEGNCRTIPTPTP